MEDVFINGRDQELIFVKLFLFKVHMAIVKLTWQHIWLRFKF
jgi:hypothetical protein